METNSPPVEKKCIEIRFGLGYSIFTIVLSVLIAFIGYMAKNDDIVLKYIMYGLSLLTLIHGIYAIFGGKYIKLDLDEKKLKIYGLFGIAERHIRFDDLAFEGKDLYRKINGKRKYINLMRFHCNREDYIRFIDFVNTHS